MSNESKAIIIQPSGSGFAVTIPGEALRQKAQALERASKIVAVTNADEQQEAIQAVAVLKGLAGGAEKTREAVKKPYWDAGKAIDAKAKEYCKEIVERAEAIERQIAEFQRKERERAESDRREEERKRQEAEAAQRREEERAAKAERDRVAAEQAAKAAEAARQQAEIDAAEASSEAELKAAADAQRAADQAAADAIAAKEAAEREAQQAEIDLAEAQDAAAEANAIVTAEAPAQATGATITEVLDFEVLDIDALYAWDLQRRIRADNLLKIRLKESGIDRPLSPATALVKLEVKRREFKEFISGLTAEELDALPGVVFIRTTKAAVRSVAPSLALQ